MSQAREVAKNTAVLALARVIERVSNLILIVFIARALDASGLGIYAAAISYFTLIAIAGEMGSTNFLVRELARDPSKTSTYVVHFATMAAALSVLVLAASWFAIPLIGYSGELQTALLIVAIAVLPGALNTIQEAVFVAHQRVEFQTLVTFIAAVVNIAISLALLARGHGAVSLVAAFVGVQCLVTVSYALILNRYIAPLRWEFDAAVARRLLGEIKTFAAISVLAAIFAQPEILILSRLSSEAQVGFYTAALKIVSLWQIIPQTFMANVFPLLSRYYQLSNDRFKFVQQKSVKYLLGVSLPVSAGIVVAADPIIQLFYGSGFDEAVLALRILAVSIPIFSVNAVLWRALVARGEEGAVLRILGINVVVRLSLTVILVASLASLGAAIAALTALAFHTLLLGFFVRRAGLEFRIVRLAGRFAAAALGMAALTAVAVARIELLFLVPLAAAVYGVLVWLLKAFSAEDVALFRGIWRTSARS
jgi:O-antigen/teichoic acid export membrane protein